MAQEFWTEGDRTLDSNEEAKPREAVDGRTQKIDFRGIY